MSTANPANTNEQSPELREMLTKRDDSDGGAVIPPGDWRVERFDYIDGVLQQGRPDNLNYPSSQFVGEDFWRDRCERLTKAAEAMRIALVDTEYELLDDHERIAVDAYVAIRDE